MRYPVITAHWPWPESHLTFMSVAGISCPKVCSLFGNYRAWLDSYRYLKEPNVFFWIWFQGPEFSNANSLPSHLATCHVHQVRQQKRVDTIFVQPFRLMGVCVGFVLSAFVFPRLLTRKCNLKWKLLVWNFWNGPSKARCTANIRILCGCGWEST